MNNLSFIFQATSLDINVTEIKIARFKYVFHLPSFKVTYMLAKLNLLRHKTMMNVAHVYFYALSSINFASKIKKRKYQEKLHSTSTSFLNFYTTLKRHLQIWKYSAIIIYVWIHYAKDFLASKRMKYCWGEIQDRFKANTIPSLICSRQTHHKYWSVNAWQWKIRCTNLYKKR